MQAAKAAIPRRVLVKDVMTKKLITVSPTTKLSDVLVTMATNNIQRLPVVDDSGKLLGIITDRDLRLALDSPFLHKKVDEEMKTLGEHKVADCMTPNVLTIEEDAPIVNAAKLMRVRNVGGLPVTGANDMLVGICTRTDLLDHLIRILEPVDEKAQDMQQ